MAKSRIHSIECVVFRENELGQKLASRVLIRADGSNGGFAQWDGDREAMAANLPLLSQVAGLVQNTWKKESAE